RRRGRTASPAGRYNLLSAAASLGDFSYPALSERELEFWDPSGFFRPRCDGVVRVYRLEAPGPYVDRIGEAPRALSHEVFREASMVLGLDDLPRFLGPLHLLRGDCRETFLHLVD